MTLHLPDCSDGELADLALAGRQAAFGELVRRHQGWVYRLVRSHVGDSEEAIDVTQTCFVSAFTALGRYDGKRSFRAWLSRIALNKCRDWHRRRAVRRLLAFALPLGEARDVADETPGADRTLAGETELERTTTAIAALPVALKQVLLLRTVEGCSEAETAEILGISQKAVETRLYRARTRLSEILQNS